MFKTNYVVLTEVESLHTVVTILEEMMGLKVTELEKSFIGEHPVVEVKFQARKKDVVGIEAIFNKYGVNGLLV